MLRKKFDRYLNKENENFSVLHHELNKLIISKGALDKRNRGVEDVETIKIEILISQFK